MVKYRLRGWNLALSVVFLLFLCALLLIAVLVAPHDGPPWLLGFSPVFLLATALSSAGLYYFVKRPSLSAARKRDWRGWGGSVGVFAGMALSRAAAQVGGWAVAVLMGLSFALLAPFTWAVAQAVFYSLGSAQAVSSEQLPGDRFNE